MDTEKFEVIFLDDDMVTVLDKQLVSRGETVTYQGKTPTKEPTIQVTYTFIGWTKEEKLENVTENLTLIAKYAAETNNLTPSDAMLKVSLENAQNANLNQIVAVGEKVNEQKKALEKESRTAEQIVSDIIKNGKTEIGKEADRDSLDR